MRLLPFLFQVLQKVKEAIIIEIPQCDSKDLRNVPGGSSAKYDFFPIFTTIHIYLPEDLIFKNPCAIIHFVFWVWRRLVARYLGVVEAVGSSPATQTKQVIQQESLCFIGSFVV